MLRGTVPSVSSGALHSFSRAPQAQIPRSSFNRSHGVKTTFDEGYLIPILVDEALPGDTFNLHMHAFARMSTPKFPLMDNLYLETFFFSVPYRLVWDNWEKFNGQQVNPGDSVDYTVPILEIMGDISVNTGDLADYFGIPINVSGFNVNSLFFRAYNLIWNEWFRDENQQDSVVVQTDDGPDTYSNYNVLQRGKRYDYFTSCLPFPQKGPDVDIPFASSAPVTYSDAYPDYMTIDNQSTGSPVGGLAFSSINTNATSYVIQSVSGAPAYTIDLGDNYIADLSSAAAVTINQLREAVQTQRLYERDARGGTRYTEIIHSHFGVTSPDMRLQRPEYLGGGSSPVIINPVAQTSPTSGGNALGQLAAYGVCAPQGHGFVKSFTEHELVIGLVCVRADLNYQQGLERMWSRQTRLDFYWPALSHLGEQAVLNQEIYLQGNGDDGEVFGYQERYAEMRYKPSLITGLFRSTASSPLDSWHLAQDFGALPVLGSDFIVENAPMSRVLAVTDVPHFLFDCFFDYKCARPMPTYAVPGLIDHF